MNQPEEPRPSVLPDPSAIGSSRLDRDVAGPLMTDAFDPATYWEKRLSQAYDLGSVGWIGLGDSFNRWMYVVRRLVFKRVVRDCLPDVSVARVLDVGSGTGFYLGLWRDLGVRDLSGSDLTAIAVTRLQASFPDAEIFRLDIGEEEVVMARDTYDVVSAMDVLFHIVDDDRYSQAVLNLSRLVRPGGLVIFSENCLDTTYPVVHQVSRSRTHIDTLLAEAQLVRVAERPMFFLMSMPIDSDSRLLRRWWSVVLKIAPRGKWAGWLMGAALCPVELALLRLFRTGPSTKILVCRRSSD